LVGLVEEVTWIEAALLAAALIGVIAGGVLVAQRPSFWFGLGTVMFRAGMPHLIEYITKRMPPEQEAEWRKCQLRGGKWNHRKKRCE
jgi:hypothetical protein